MSSRARLASLLVAGVGFALFASIPARAEFRVPPLSSPVVDEAGMLAPTTRTRLEGALRTLHEQAGTQLAVLTVPSLEGLTIEQASIRVAEAWKLGSEREDDGVLLMVARDERRIRIEVGQGLEGALTDAYSKRIIDESMMPLFRDGDFGGGITLGIYEIARRTNPDFDLRPQLEGSLRTPTRQPASRRKNGGLGLLFVLILVSITLMRVGGFGGYSRRRRYPWGGGFMGGGGFGGGFRGGGFGGGGFGGGGFSGGGGGFSGGGASGGW